MPVLDSDIVRVLVAEAVLDPTTAQPLTPRLRNVGFSTPSALANGDVWIELAGASPNRVVTLNIRDNGATVSIPLATF